MKGRVPGTALFRANISGGAGTRAGSRGHGGEETPTSRRDVEGEGPVTRRLCPWRHLPRRLLRDPGLQEAMTPGTVSRVRGSGAAGLGWAWPAGLAFKTRASPGFPLRTSADGGTNSPAEQFPRSPDPLAPARRGGGVFASEPPPAKGIEFVFVGSGFSL